MKRWLLMLALLPMLIARPSLVHAQLTRLRLSGFPLTFGTPTASDFSAGQITSTDPITFDVLAVNGTNGAQRTTTVSIRCSAPCPAQGTKALSSLRWRRSDLATWNTLTTSDVTIESRAVIKGGTNDPWSNSVFFQFLLDWTNDPASATANRYNVIMTLTVTVP